MLSSDWQHAVHGFRTVEKVPVPQTESEVQTQEEGVASSDSDSTVANDADRDDAEEQNEEVDVEEHVGAQSGASSSSMSQVGLGQSLPGVGPSTNDAPVLLSVGSSLLPPGSTTAIPTPASASTIPHFAYTPTPQQHHTQPHAVVAPPTNNAANAGNTNINANGATMHRIRIRDWNPYTIRRAQAALEREQEEARQKGKGKATAMDTELDSQGTAESDDWRECGIDASERVMRGRSRLVTKPSTIAAGAAFIEDIVSWLPYREVVSEEVVEVSDVMMDDSRVLCLKVCFTLLHLAPWCFFGDVADLSLCFAERTERTAVRDGCADVLNDVEVLLGADL